MGENVNNKDKDRLLLEAIFNQNEVILRQNRFIIEALDYVHKSLSFQSPPCMGEWKFRTAHEKSETALEETDQVRHQLSIDKQGRFL